MSEALILEPEQLLCPNCSKKVKEKHKYCPSCGQSTRFKRIEISEIWSMTIKKLLHADSTVLNLLKGFVTRPGGMVLDFIGGKRKQIYSPIKFLFYSAGISVFVSEYFRLFELMPNTGEFGEFASRYNNVFTLLNVPASALLTWLFFRKKGFNFSEHLVLNAFLTGFNTVFFVLLFAPLIVFFPEQYGIGTLIYSVCWVIYFSWVNVGFFGGTVWKVTLKTAGIYFLSQIFLTLLMFLALFIKKKIVG